MLFVRPIIPQVVGRDSAVGRCPASKLTGHIGCDDKSVNMGGGSRWVLERAVAGTNLYRIRMQARRPVPPHLPDGTEAPHTCGLCLADRSPGWEGTAHLYDRLQQVAGCPAP